MKEQPKKEVHYEKEVWVNPTTELLRKIECLCLNCAFLKPGKKQETYQMDARKGDIVAMPNNVMGIVSLSQIIAGGNCKMVKVHPFTNWSRRFLLYITGKTWFYDQEINKLQLIYRTIPDTDNCPIAQALYEICVKENVALMVTRCSLWKPNRQV